MGIEDDSTQQDLRPYAQTDEKVPRMAPKPATNKTICGPGSSLGVKAPSPFPLAADVKVPDVITHVPDSETTSDFAQIHSQVGKRTGETMGISTTGEIKAAFDEEDEFTKSSIKILNEKSGAIIRLYEFVTSKLEKMQSYEEKESLWGAAECANLTFLNKKHIDPVHFTRNVDAWTMYQVYNQIFCKILSPCVRRIIMNSLFEFIMSSEPHEKSEKANALANALDNYLKPSGEMTPSVEQILREELDAEHPYKTFSGGGSPTQFPFISKSKDYPTTWGELLSGLYDLRMSETPLATPAEQIFRFIRGGNEFDPIINEHIGACIKKTLKTGQTFHMQQLSNDLMQVGEHTPEEEPKIEMDNYLSELFTLAAREGFMTQEVLSQLYVDPEKGIHKMTPELAQLLLTAVQKGLASFQDLSKYITTDARIALLRRIGSFDKITVEDFRGICQAMQRKLDEIDSEIDKIGTIQKLRFRQEYKNLKRFTKYARDFVLLPQLALYGEIVFSETLAVPGNTPSFEETNYEEEQNAQKT